MPTSGEGEMEARTLASLLSVGWNLNAAALQKSSFSVSPSEEERLQHMEAELLEMDLKEIGAPSLPDASAMQRRQRLSGPLVLQVVSVRDISESNIKALTRISIQKQQGRLLRICLTDGISTIKAIEYGPIPQLSLDIPPGTKVRMENCRVQSGIVLLDSQNFHVLGGHVQALFDAWEMEHKYSGLARSTLRLPQEEGASARPAFKSLDVSSSAKSHSYESRQKTEQVQEAVFSRRLMASNYSEGTNTSTSKSSLRPGYTAERPETATLDENTVKNSEKAPLSSIKRGFEIFKPKAQRDFFEEAQLVHTEKELPKPFFPGSVDASDDTLVTGHTKDHGAIESTVLSEKTISHTEGSTVRIPKQTETRFKSSTIDGRAKAINAAISLGLDATPLQNRAAAQKLLEKRIDFVSKDGHYDGRRGRWKGESTGRGSESRLGRGGRNKEKETFTLDEWESRKAAANCSSDSRQQDSDAELAWKLQKQMNMQDDEVAAVKEMDEAGKICMSMFNFAGGKSDQESLTGRARGRGRGRGRRRGH